MSRILHDQTKNLDVRNGAVFAKAKINKGTKFGPFIAKFTDKPLDRRFAWEVSRHNFCPIIHRSPFLHHAQQQSACVLSNDKLTSRAIILLLFTMLEYENNSLSAHTDGNGDIIVITLLLHDHYFRLNNLAHPSFILLHSIHAMTIFHSLNSLLLNTSHHIHTMNAQSFHCSLSDIKISRSCSASK